MKGVVILTVAACLLTGGVYASRLVDNTIDCKRSQETEDRRMSVKLAGCLDFEKAAVDTQALGEQWLKEGRQLLRQWIR